MAEDTETLCSPPAQRLVLFLDQPPTTQDSIGHLFEGDMALERLLPIADAWRRLNMLALGTETVALPVYSVMDGPLRAISTTTMPECMLLFDQLKSSALPSSAPLPTGSAYSLIPLRVEKVVEGIQHFLACVAETRKIAAARQAAPDAIRQFTLTAIALWRIGYLFVDGVFHCCQSETSIHLRFGEEACHINLVLTVGTDTIFIDQTVYGHQREFSLPAAEEEAITTHLHLFSASLYATIMQRYMHDAKI